MRNKRGTILITTLWITAILTLFALGIGFRTSLEVRLNKFNIDKLEARYLAKAGITKASEMLLNDMNENYDSLYECGISLDLGSAPEVIFSDEFNELGNGSFSVYYTRKKEYGPGEEKYYGIVDEERKINIKLSRLEKIVGYKEILQRLDPKITEDIVNAIIDWQDGGDFDSETAPGGAEDSYYETEFGYSCKDADLESVEELLLVKDMTPEIFDRIKNYVTVYSNGLININTAPQKVLEAIIDDGTGTYRALVDNIIQFRKGDDGEEGTGDDGVLMAVEDIPLLAKEVHERNRLSQLSPYFTVKAENFRIVSHGSVNNITKTITYVINRNPAPEEKRVKYYHEE